MRVVSTHIFCNRRLHTALLDRFAETGAEGVELFCARQSFDYTEHGQVEGLASWFRQNPLQLHSLHSPLFTDDSWGRSGDPPVDIAHPDRRRRILAVDEVQRVLELADTIPYRYLVQHVGVGGSEADPRRAEAAFSSLERLRVLAKQAGVGLLIENIPNGQSMPEALMRFLEETHLDDVGVCFDAGHAHLPADHHFGGGGALLAFERMRGRIRSTHLHDNRGEKDDHLWPGEGSINWGELMPKLGAEASVPWVLEIANQAEEAPAFARLRETWDHLARWTENRES